MTKQKSKLLEHQIEIEGVKFAGKKGSGFNQLLIFAGKQINGVNYIIYLHKSLYNGFFSTKNPYDFTYIVKAKKSKSSKNLLIATGIQKLELDIPDLQVIPSKNRFVDVKMGKSVLFRYCYDIFGFLEPDAFYMTFIEKVSTDYKLHKLYQRKELIDFVKRMKIALQNLSTSWNQEFLIDTRYEIEILRGIP